MIKCMMTRLTKLQSCGKVVSCAIVSLVVGICFTEALPVDARLFYSESVLSWVVIALLFCMLWKYSSLLRVRFKKNRRECVLTCLLALLFSAFTVFGANLVDEAQFNPFSLKIIAAILGCSIPFVFGLEALWILLDRLQDRHLGKSSMALDRADEKQRIFRSASTKWIVVVFALLMVAWTPYFLAAWPGFFCYDLNNVPIAEWSQYHTRSFHALIPIFHTILMGSIIEAGMALFGDIHGGVALYTFFQMIVLAALFTGVLVWLRKCGASKVLVYGSLLYYILDPVIGMFVVCDTRDVLFSALFVVFCSFAYLLASLGGASKKHRVITLLAFVLLGFLTAIIRTNGLYAIAVGTILALILAKKGTRRFFVGGACAIVALCMIWQGPVYAALSVTPSERTKIEMMGVVIQQMAYVTTNDELSDVERENLEAIGYGYPDHYRPNLSDPSKHTINGVRTKDLMLAYLRLGLNHPASYAKAELLRSEDMWSPYSIIDCYNGESPSYDSKATSFFAANTEIYGGFEEIDTSKFPWLLEVLKNIGGQIYLQKIPGLSILVSLPFYIWVMLIAVCRCLIKFESDREKLILLGFYLGLLVTLYLAPAVVTRYYLFLFFGLPVLLWCLGSSHALSEHDEGKDCLEMPKND